MTAVLENRFQPAPGAAPLRQMVGAQAALETRQLLRNGEQLTLTLIIPLLLLAAFSLEPLISFGGGYTQDRLPHPGRDRAGDHVHRVHQPGDRHRVRAAGTGCSSGSAPPRCRGPG